MEKLRLCRLFFDKLKITGVLVLVSLVSCDGSEMVNTESDSYFLTTRLSDLQLSKVTLDFAVGETFSGIQDGMILPVSLRQDPNSFSYSVSVSNMEEDKLYTYWINWKLNGVSIAQRLNFMRLDSESGIIQENPSLLTLTDYCLPDDDLDDYSNLQEFDCGSDELGNAEFCSMELAKPKRCEICPILSDCCDPTLGVDNCT